jgi:hypothetical protein
MHKLIIKKTANILYYMLVPSWVQKTYSVCEFAYCVYQWKEKPIKKIIMNKLSK